MFSLAPPGMNPQEVSLAYSPRPSLGLLLLGLLLLLPAVLAVPGGDLEGDLQCLCVKTSRPHLKRISHLQVIRAGLHCPTTQLIATLQNGKKVCLDPQARLYMKIIKKFFEGELRAA